MPAKLQAVEPVELAVKKKPQPDAAKAYPAIPALIDGLGQAVSLLLYETPLCCCLFLIRNKRVVIVNAGKLSHLCLIIIDYNTTASEIHLSTKQKIASDLTTDTDAEALHPIQVVVRRTAISAHVIRAWERRYGAVVPKRSDTNRRLYTDEDIQRLRLLNRAIGLGRRIGDVARLSLTDLQALINEDQEAIEQAPAVIRNDKPSAVAKMPVGDQKRAEAIDACIQAIEMLNPVALETVLARAAINYSAPVLLEEVIQQVMQIVGQRWQEGGLRLCHEHMATSVIRSFLGAMTVEAADSEVNEYAPILLTTTPDGQRHELGALMVALVAAFKGWQPLYLGASTPTDEIVFATAERSARAVALSISYPGDDPHLPAILKRLRRQLPREIPILVGGASASSYRDALEAIDAICPSDLSTLQTALDDIRERNLTQ